MCRQRTLNATRASPFFRSSRRCCHNSGGPISRARLHGEVCTAKACPQAKYTCAGILICRSYRAINPLMCGGNCFVDPASQGLPAVPCAREFRPQQRPRLPEVGPLCKSVVAKANGIVAPEGLGVNQRPRHPRLMGWEPHSLESRVGYAQ